MVPPPQLQSRILCVCLVLLSVVSLCVGQQCIQSTCGECMGEGGCCWSQPSGEICVEDSSCSGGAPDEIRDTGDCCNIHNNDCLGCLDSGCYYNETGICSTEVAPISTPEYCPGYCSMQYSCFGCLQGPCCFEPANGYCQESQFCEEGVGLFTDSAECSCANMNSCSDCTIPDLDCCFDPQVGTCSDSCTPENIGVNTEESPECPAFEECDQFFQCSDCLANSNCIFDTKYERCLPSGTSSPLVQDFETNSPYAVTDIEQCPPRCYETSGCAACAFDQGCLYDLDYESCFNSRYPTPLHISAMDDCAAQEVCQNYNRDCAACTDAGCHFEPRFEGLCLATTIATVHSISDSLNCPAPCEDYGDDCIRCAADYRCLHCNGACFSNEGQPDCGQEPPSYAPDYCDPQPVCDIFNGDCVSCAGADGCCSYEDGTCSFYCVEVSAYFYPDQCPVDCVGIYGSDCENCNLDDACCFNDQTSLCEKSTTCEGAVCSAPIDCEATYQGDCLGCSGDPRCCFDLEDPSYLCRNSYFNDTCALPATLDECPSCSAYESTTDPCKACQGVGRCCYSSLGEGSCLGSDECGENEVLTCPSDLCPSLDCDACVTHPDCCFDTDLRECFTSDDAQCVLEAQTTDECLSNICAQLECLECFDHPNCCFDSFNLVCSENGLCHDMYDSPDSCPTVCAEVADCLTCVEDPFCCYEGGNNTHAGSCTKATECNPNTELVRDECPELFCATIVDGCEICADAEGCCFDAVSGVCHSDCDFPSDSTHVQTSEECEEFVCPNLFAGSCSTCLSEPLCCWDGSVCSTATGGQCEEGSKGTDEGCTDCGLFSTCSDCEDDECCWDQMYGSCQEKFVDFPCGGALEVSCAVQEACAALSSCGECADSAADCCWDSYEMKCLASTDQDFCEYNSFVTASSDCPAICNATATTCSECFESPDSTGCCYDGGVCFVSEACNGSATLSECVVVSPTPTVNPPPTPTPTPTTAPTPTVIPTPVVPTPTGTIDEICGAHTDCGACTVFAELSGEKCCWQINACLPRSSCSINTLEECPGSLTCADASGCESCNYQSDCCWDDDYETCLPTNSSTCELSECYVNEGCSANVDCGSCQSDSCCWNAQLDTCEESFGAECDASLNYCNDLPCDQTLECGLCSDREDCCVGDSGCLDEGSCSTDATCSLPEETCAQFLSCSLCHSSSDCCWDGSTCGVAGSTCDRSVCTASTGSVCGSQFNDCGSCLSPTHGLDCCWDQVNGCIDVGSDAQTDQCGDVCARNPCAQGRACPSGSECLWVPPSSSKCVCPAGYQLVGTQCTDIDECALDTSLCDETNGTCDGASPPGGFTCGCIDGFVLSPDDDATCVEIEEEATCGNGVIDSGEQCDDITSLGCVDCRCVRSFGVSPTSPAKLTCSITQVSVNSFCGDGIVGGDEVCELGGVGCGADCLCLDGFEANSPIITDCKRVDLTAETVGRVCGDGIVNFSDGEQCEIGLDAHCTSSCTCQAGYAADGKGKCNVRDLSFLCGNGLLDPFEECDNGEFNGASPVLGCSKCRCDRASGFYPSVSKSLKCIQVTSEQLSGVYGDYWRDRVLVEDPCNGDGVVDDCGNCQATPATWNLNCVKSCDASSNAATEGYQTIRALDGCGICRSPPTDSHPDPNWVQEGDSCVSQCDVIGEYPDHCGNCLLPSSPNWNSCLGCDGVVNSGFTLDQCGVCLHPEEPAFNECPERRGCDGVVDSGYQYVDGFCKSPLGTVMGKGVGASGVITPELHCWEEFVCKDGTARCYRAFLGWHNDGPRVTLAVGDENSFAIVEDLGQPTEFAPGPSSKFPRSPLVLSFTGRDAWTLTNETLSFKFCDQEGEDGYLLPCDFDAYRCPLSYSAIISASVFDPAYTGGIAPSGSLPGPITSALVLQVRTVIAQFLGLSLTRVSVSVLNGPPPSTDTLMAPLLIKVTISANGDGRVRVTTNSTKRQTALEETLEKSTATASEKLHASNSAVLKAALAESGVDSSTKTKTDAFEPLSSPATDQPSSPSSSPAVTISIGLSFLFLCLCSSLLFWDISL